MKPEVSVSAELDFRELFEQNGKLAVRYIETLQAVITAQDKCIRAMTAALKDATDTAEQMLDLLLENTKKGGTAKVKKAIESYKPAEKPTNDINP